jgi:predicted ester cyclase
VVSVAAAERNKAVVRRFTDDWLNRNDLTALEETVDPDVFYHWGPLGSGRGRDALRELELSARTAFPDLTVSSQALVADDERVVEHARVEGTHEGTWFGVARTGRHAEWTALCLYRIADGRIVEQWLNEDWTSVLQQLGAVGEP